MMWGYYNNPMWGYNSYGGYGGYSFFGSIFMLIFWILIIVGIVAFIRWLIMSRRREYHGHEKTPLDILRERYAKGEIDKEEFEAKKKDLNL